MPKNQQGSAQGMKVEFEYLSRKETVILLLILLYFWLSAIANIASSHDSKEYSFTGEVIKTQEKDKAYVQQSVLVSTKERTVNIYLPPTIITDEEEISASLSGFRA